MVSRRGSVYDPARDSFKVAEPIKPSEAHQHGHDATASPSSPSSNKRKRSPTPSTPAATHRRTFPPTPEDQQLSSKEVQPFPVQPIDKSDAPQPTSNFPQSITAAGLSEISSAKKPARERTEPVKKIKERRRERIPTSRRRSRSPIQRTSLDSRERRRSPPSQRSQKSPSPPPLPRSPSRSPPRKRKKPGASSRVSTSNAEVVRKRQQEREDAQKKEAEAEAAERGVLEVVRQHYNAVPERGREWRKESMIKGLRTFNNWVKSAVIQKFSPNDDFTPGARHQSYNQRDDDGKGLMVLDIGCGKGGDLQKWQNAPQRVEFYVGIDGADVSIDQARGRYASMPRFARGGEFRGRRRLDARFLVEDCFGTWLGNIPILNKIGVDPHYGPERAPVRPGGAGGFDIVSMMFCMHYAFESEEKSRRMLENVAGALKKGGRLIGVIPNSDVLSAKIKQFKQSDKKAPAQSDQMDDLDSDWDPEKPTEPTTNGESMADADSDDDWDPEKPSDPQKNDPSSEQLNGTSADQKESKDSNASKPTNSESDSSPKPPLEWGNPLYRISFPNSASLPVDGTFRPPWGWKYFFFLEEAVEQVPEYVVPWESFRALAADYDLELQYRRPFTEVWKEESHEPGLRELSEKMGVRDRETGEFRVSRDEMEAISFYHAFCFYKA